MYCCHFLTPPTSLTYFCITFGPPVRRKRNNNDLVWPSIMLTHSSHCCAIVTGAAQTLALYWSLLSSHFSQNDRRREQCLTHTWTHSHQPKQIHCVRPQSYGEDHLWEAECGARSSDSLNLSTPLLLSLHIPLCWKVNIFFLCSRLLLSLMHCSSFHGVGQIESALWGLYWRITLGFPLYFKGGDPKHWETGSPAKSLLMPACFL